MIYTLMVLLATLLGATITIVYYITTQLYT